MPVQPRTEGGRIEEQSQLTTARGPRLFRRVPAGCRNQHAGSARSRCRPSRASGAGSAGFQPPPSGIPDGRNSQRPPEWHAQSAENPADSPPHFSKLLCARLLGHRRHLRDRRSLALLRWSRRRFRLRRQWGEILHFTAVEPNEMTQSTNIDGHGFRIRKRNCQHRLRALRTRPAGLSFVVDGMKPKWIDRFRREGTTQKLNRNGAAAALIAMPEPAVRQLRLSQLAATRRA